MTTTDRTPADIDPAALLALAEAATPLPWLQGHHVGEPCALTTEANPDMSLLGLDRDGMAIVMNAADAAYIVAACNAVPALVARLQAAEARADAAQARAAAAEHDRDALLAPRCNADVAADPAGDWCVWIGGGRAVETHKTLESAKIAAARWQALIDDARRKRDGDAAGAGERGQA